MSDFPTGVLATAIARAGLIGAAAVAPQAAEIVNVAPDGAAPLSPPLEEAEPFDWAEDAELEERRRLAERQLPLVLVDAAEEMEEVEKWVVMQVEHNERSAAAASSASHLQVPAAMPYRFTGSVDISADGKWSISMPAHEFVATESELNTDAACSLQNVFIFNANHALRIFPESPEKKKQHMQSNSSCRNIFIYIYI